MSRLSLGSLAPKILLFAGISLLLSSVFAHAESASKIYSRGKSAEAHNDFETAYSYYEKAYKQDPSNIKFKAAYERARFSAADVHVRKGEQFKENQKLTAALVEFVRALAIDPGNERAEQDIRHTKEVIDGLDKNGNAIPKPAPSPKAAPPAELALQSSDPITLHMTEASGIIFQTLGRTAGVNVILDPDYTGKRITVDLKEVTFPEALQIVCNISNSFWKPVTRNTIFVAANTRAKHQEINDQAIQVFYLSNVSQQNDLNDVLTALRNVMNTAKMYGLPSQNAIVVHGTPDELFVAKRMIAALDRPKPEVLVDVWVMEVSRDKIRNIGLSMPTSLSVSASSSATLNTIARSSSYTYSMGSATAEMLLTDSDTKIMQNPRVRAIDGQKATLKIGSRIPVATGTYTTTSTTSGVQTQFQYIDVGVNIDLTPTIHSDHDVTLKLAVEVSSESGTQTISGVEEPIISQQKSEQVIRLKDGEVSLLAGLISKKVSDTVSGTPGLGEIPLLKYLFSTQKHEVSNDDIVFMLVPHVVRTPDPDEESSREMSTGSGGTIQINRIILSPPQDQPAKPTTPQGAEILVPEVTAGTGKE